MLLNKLLFEMQPDRAPREAACMLLL